MLIKVVISLQDMADSQSSTSKSIKSETNFFLYIFENFSLIHAGKREFNTQK